MSVKLAEMEGQSTILDLWCGSASVTTKLPTTYYKLNLSSTLGSVSRNGKSEGKKLNEPGNTASRISSSVLFGNASVSFEGENEENYVPKTVFDPPQPETDESVPDLTEMVPVL